MMSSVGNSNGQQVEGCSVSSSHEVGGTVTLSVEGNIGSGKSTFLEYICNTRADIATYPEPIEKWRNVQGENLLARYYDDPRRWGSMFQLQVGMTVLDIYHRRTWKTIKLVERSLLSSRYCFLEHMKRTQVITPLEGHVLDGWYERSFLHHRSRPHAIVYLCTSPDVAYGRMQARARSEESAVSLATLMELNRLHEEWIEREQSANLASLSERPVYVIDANQTGGALRAQYESCLCFMDLLSCNA